MELIKSTTSLDETKKYYFQPFGQSEVQYNHHIEACLLYLQRHGNIICVSSQLGCSQSCTFCAAGIRPFIRNLTSSEIEHQVKWIVEDNPKLRQSKFQVTYMGSGEPLANWNSVFSSINNLRDHNRSLEKVNISTIWPMIATACSQTIDWRQYVGFIHLQFSLHFPDDAERGTYFRAQLPSILESIDCLEHIAQLVHDTYRINYVVFDGVNDTDQHIKKLAEIMKHTKNAVLKISQMCEIKDCKLAPSHNFEIFVQKVKQLSIPCEVFKSSGTDIHAGCGQFYNNSVI